MLYCRDECRRASPLACQARMHFRESQRRLGPYHGDPRRQRNSIANARLTKGTRNRIGQQDQKGPRSLGAGLIPASTQWKPAMDGYRIFLTPDDNGTFLVTCPDLPEVTSFAEDETDALLRARDAIEEAIAARIAHRKDIPSPPDGDGLRVFLPALTVAKIELYRTANAEHVRKAELARRLGMHGPQVDRLFDLRHTSQLPQLEAAFEAMGRRLVVNVEPLPAPPPR
jgi:antitoxin HicB